MGAAPQHGEAGTRPKSLKVEIAIRLALTISRPPALTA